MDSLLLSPECPLQGSSVAEFPPLGAMPPADALHAIPTAGARSEGTLSLILTVLRVCQEVEMDEDKFNMSLRKFLKQVGVTSQREIERIAREKKPVKGKLKVKVVLTAAGTELNHVVEGEIDLR